MDLAITKFEEQYHYEQKDVSGGAGINLGLDVVLSKKISDKEGNYIDLEIDACTFENEGAKKFHEDPSKELPYSLCDIEENKTGVTLDGDKKVSVTSLAKNYCSYSK